MTRGLASFSRRLSGVANALSTVGAVLAGIVFVGMSLLVVVDVVLRNTIGRSTLIASEYSGYALAAMTYLSLAFTFREGAHIRITFVHDRLPPAIRRPAEVLLVAFAAVVTFVGVLSVREMVATSFERGTIAYTVARTPLWIPQGIVLIGLALLLVQLIAYGLAVATGGPILDEAVDEADVDELTSGVS